jgi:hypothetical protein
MMDKKERKKKNPLSWLVKNLSQDIDIKAVPDSILFWKEAYLQLGFWHEAAERYKRKGALR